MAKKKYRFKHEHDIFGWHMYVMKDGLKMKAPSTKAQATKELNNLLSAIKRGDYEIKG